MNQGLPRKFTFQAIIAAVGLIFLVRLFYLQILDPSYTQFARNNVLNEQVIHPSRGLIHDRNGELLVYNDAIYDLMVIPKKVVDIDTNEFCELLKISKESFIAKIKKASPPYKASVFEKNITPKTFAAFQEKLFSFPGFFVEVKSDRRYRHNNAAHVLGYIGEVSEKQIANNPYYKSRDYIGISGIEKSYEESLRGTKGKKLILVDVMNREQGSYKNGFYDSLPVSGQNIVTGLDFRIQSYGEELMKNKIGSIVAIEPSTGEILALVNSPSYDPNLLIGRERGSNYVKLLRDPVKPLYNRALSASYPPGSTFKLVMALIGMQEGVLSPESRYPCQGGYHLGRLKIGCHAHTSMLDLRQSIQHSCNAYYCHVFRNVIDKSTYKTTQIGFENWQRHLSSFGLGRKLDIDLAHENKGLVPSVARYDRAYGKGRWKSTTILSLAIGQAEIGTTPLQLANVAAIIANRGYFYTPHIIKSVGDSAHTRPEFLEKHYTTVDPKYYPVVIEGMHDVVEHGTGTIAKLPGVPICAKTGTAQNPHGKDHSIFIAFAPMDNPKIAIAVIVENAGFGAAWAAPIASLMIEKYLNDGAPTTRPELEERMLKADLISGNATK